MDSIEVFVDQVLYCVLPTPKSHFLIFQGEDCLGEIIPSFNDQDGLSWITTDLIDQQLVDKLGLEIERYQW